MSSIFITGGTGYLGYGLIEKLLGNGHQVHALVRKGSEKKLPLGARPIIGNALNRTTFINNIRPSTTYVQLVGVSHPSPAKANQFREVDLVSARESIAAAVHSGIQHFVYVSVAHPAPVMQSYIDVRLECEAMLKESGLNATILRPFYVLGPGHWWPYIFKPVYWLSERIPAARELARRLGMVTLHQMLQSLVWAVEHPARGICELNVQDIKRDSRENVIN